MMEKPEGYTYTIPSVDSYFHELRKISFPYPKYTDNEMMA